MQFKQVCSFNIIPSSKPYRKTYNYKDSNGDQQESASLVVKGVLIPDNPGADRTSVQEIEISAREYTNDNIKKAFYDAYDAWHENKDDFKDGKKYMVVESFMGSRGRNGVVTYFSPIMKDFSVVEVTEEDKKYITAALRTNDQENV